MASAIVIASIGAAAWLVVSELSNEEPGAELSTGLGEPTSTPPAAPTTAADGPLPTVSPAQSTPATVGDPFEELRYLPTGSVAGMELQTVIRIPDATPIAAFVRTGRSRKVTAAVFVDRAANPLADGVGVTGSRMIDVDGQTAELVSSGPALSHMVSWDHPNFGPLRAWSMGAAAGELEEVVSASARWLEDEQTTLPDDWTHIDAYGADGIRATWRTMYITDGGEVMAISTSATSPTASAVLAPDLCVEEVVTSACENVHVTIDADGVEIILLASADRLDLISRQLRPVTASNARIRSTEIEPRAEVAPSATRRLLYLPEDSDEWSIVEIFAHSSGEPVSGPALVLLERDAPEIGAITSAVVVRHVEEGSDGPAQSVDTTADVDEGSDEPKPSDGQSVDDEQVEEEPAAEAAPVDEDGDLSGPSGTIERFIVEKSGITLEIASWNHFQLELALVNRLLSVDDSGVRFASRAASSVGLERSYDDVLLDPLPVIAVEGPVFAVRFENEAGDQTVLRASFVPGYVPEAVAVLPHDNERITVRIRGAAASLIVRGDEVKLAWEEQPGVLITLTGSDEAELVRLANALELVRAEDIDAA